MILEISEIFYSLQGEGNRKGTANIFIRTKGCKAKDACYAIGIRCDTEFESGSPIDLKDLKDTISKYPCKSIIWTGGEPLQQLTSEVVEYFGEYYQAVETSGLFPAPEGLDYIVVSPKVAEHVVKKNFSKGVQELRYVRHVGQSIPQPSIEAEYYYISPHSDGWDINMDNLKHCIELIKSNPQWRLSVQDHKLWSVL